jgi:hypothetical protein
VTQQKLNSSIIAGNIIILLLTTSFANAQTNVSFVSAYGYDSCIALKNKNIEVVLEPNAGGRVIRYALNGVNVLYEDSTQNGWISTAKMLRSKGHLAGGRFDIGPSRTKPNTDLFFFGKWKAVITGESSVKLISQTDAATGMYLIREFKLDKTTSKLICRQTIVNSGTKVLSASFWARTFAAGNGICVMPVPEKSRFPNKYIMFMNRDTINMFPSDSNIIQQDGCLIIKGPPQKPKLEMDISAPGWIAYAATTDLLFVKKFRVYNDKRYGDVTAANTSVWYNGVQMTEIEPIGPLEVIQPGERKSFTEEWFLKSYPFPSDRKIKTGQIQQLMEDLK